MTGSRDDNLRSGQVLAEDAGTTLLRRFAFVAPVPNGEDVGVDAVATLFRRDGRTLYAEGSFLVQYKTPSIKDVKYKDHEIDWLFDLRLPLYLAWVEHERLRLRVYSTAQHSLHCLPYRKMRLHPRLRFVPDAQGVKDEDGWLVVGLGPPVLEVSSSDIEDEVKMNRLADVLAAWVELDQVTTTHRAAGFFAAATWETNALPVERGPIATAESRHSPRVLAALKHATPALVCIGAQLRATGTPQQQQAVETLTAYLRQIGAWRW